MYIVENGKVLNMKEVLAIFFICCVQFINKYEAANCAESASFGESDPGSMNSNVDTDTGLSLLLLATNARFTFDCCGKIKAWEYYAKTNTGTMYLQVWRDDGTTWHLVGQNTLTLGAGDIDKETLYTVPTSEQVSITNNDVIGIYTPGTAILSYDSSGGNSNSHRHTTSISTATIGSTFAWGSAPQRNNRAYAVRAITTGGNNPTFGSNLDHTLNIYDDTAVGTTLYTIAATDADPLDTLTYTHTAVTGYNFNSVSLEITTTASVSVGTSTLAFTVTDVCGNSDSGNLIINVLNYPPVINNLPNYATVFVGETVERLLIHLNVTDQSLADTVTCSMTTSPASTDFHMRYVTGTADYGIYLKANPTGLASGPILYTVSVSCTDTKDTDTDTFSIYITDNSPPVMTNLQGNTTVSATSTAVGSTIFTISSTDAESDQLYYNMTTDPATTPFAVLNSGAVITTSDLSLTTVNGYDLYIYVFDGHNLVGPKTLTITVTDLNNAPVINNLPLTTALAVPENSALGMSIFQVLFTDTDVGNTHTFTATYDPGTAASLFSIDSSSGKVSTSSSNNINYEALASKTVNVTVSLSDGQASTSAVLALSITDVNEAPVFGKASYAITGNEGVAGAVVGTPAFDDTDPDAGATKSYSVDCAQFTIDPSTGVVTFSADYDVDSGAATSASCTATVSDGYLTDTATLEVTVNNINDNAPQFIKKNYVFYPSYNSIVGTVIGTLTANDADITPYGDLTFSLNQTALSQEFFGVTSTGSVYIQNDLSSLSSGTTFTITATASDSGGQSDSATITIIIPATTTSVTTTTTVTYKQFFDDGRNLAWFTILMLILCGLIGVIAFLLYRYTNCSRCLQYCRKRKKINRWPNYRREPEFPRLKSFQRTPTPPPIPDGKLWDAWKISDYGERMY